MKALVIGLGRVGWEYSKTRGLEASHFGAYIANKKITSVLGVETNLDRSNEIGGWILEQEKAGKIPVDKAKYTNVDYVTAIKDEQPDIVSVCTPTPSHYEIMRDIIHPKGPSVICLEKPVGSSLDEANRVANRQAYVWGMTRDSAQPKPKVAVHFDRRWHSTWRKVKELLDKGEIGEPKLAIGHHPGPLLRSGIHMLDLFNWYFGAVEEARSLNVADSWMTKKYPETDDVAYNADIYFKNGTRALLLGADLADVEYQLFELEIYGTKGSVSVCDNGMLLVQRKLEERTSYGGLKALDMDWSRDAGYDKVEFTKYDVQNGMVIMVDDLVQAVEDPKHQLASNLEDGVNAQLLMSMISQSDFQWMKPDNVNPQETVKSI